MKITDIKLHILENPAKRGRVISSVQVANLLRIQYAHEVTTSTKPLRQSFIEVHTDEGVSGRCTTANIQPHHIEILRNHVLGEDPLHRESLYQMLHKSTRWVYQPAGWFGDFDNCLWDIAGKVAGLPVYSLLGKVRERFPVYLTGPDRSMAAHHEGTTADYLESIELGKAMGINAYKFHTFKGGKADIPIYHEVRRIVGPDYALISDPVCSYTLREAIEVGHVMEELGFVWLEEPFHEQKMHQYQVLCRELTIPVMATEMIMNDVGLTAEWLIQGATDRLRVNARNGTTAALKLAHFAELYDANVELNGQGGLFGLIHAHLGCCIDNTDYYEFYFGTADGNRAEGEQWGMLNAPIIEDGHIVPPDGPGWGTLWDEERFRSLIVATH